VRIGAVPGKIFPKVTIKLTLRREVGIQVMIMSDTNISRITTNIKYGLK
jgi:hypothetical protein